MPISASTEFSKAIFGIASTMARAHQHSAVHGKLRSANVFLDDRWEPRIADFGLAKVVTSDVPMSMFMCSPVFMAPELYADDDGEMGPVDVYAFGIILYSIFTPQQVFNVGERPPRSPQQLMTKVVMGGRFARQPGIPDPFWDLITACWAHVPSDRPSFEEIVKLMLTTDDFVLEGTDMIRYDEYRERMKPPVQVEITPEGSAGLLMSRLAAGDQLFADEMTKSMRRLMSMGRPGGGI
jgi:serine/threonine protein kinase